MKAALVSSADATPEYAEVDPPAAQADGVIVEVSAAALNPVDLQLAAAAGPDQFPFTPGREGVGLDPDGRRVYFERTLAPHGSLAPLAVAPAGTTIELPDGVEDTTAVAFGVAGLAGWLSLERRAKLERGETVLVLGAGGAVGQVAVQAARLLGAGRVVAAARSSASRERAERLGADATVDLSSGDDIAAAITDATAGGAHVTIDTVWGAPAAAAIKASAAGGRHIQIGEAAGAEAPIAAGPLRMRQIAVMGYANAHVPDDAKRDAYLRILDHATAGRLKLEIVVSPLAEIDEIWRRQRESKGVKHVVRVK